MISYDKLWRFMATADPETGRRRKLNELYDRPGRADPIGISKPTIDRMRQGYTVSLETIEKICKRLDLQPGDILEYRPGDQPAYHRQKKV